MGFHLKALPTIEAELEQTKEVTGFEPSNCSCNACKEMCRRVPCLGTPKEIAKLIEAGYGDRIHLTTWAAGLPFGIAPIEMLQAGYDTQKGCCAFFAGGKCELHALGLKPTEGRLANHENAGVIKPNKLPLPVAVAMYWLLAAANFLGLLPNKIKALLSAGKKRYAYHSETKAKYAVRAISQAEYDAEFKARGMRNKTSKV